MKKILLTNLYKGEPLEIVKSTVPEGFQLLLLEEMSQEALSAAVPEADYILAGGRLKINEDVLKEAKKLKMIQRSGVGLDALDLDAIKARNIPLYVNQGVNSESAAEHTLLMMLACLRKLPTIDRNTKNGIWKKQEQGVQTAELMGKTVGIIGMGNIAKHLVSLLKPFHVKILYFNLFRQPDDYEKDNNMQFVGLDELLNKSDIVSIHCALTPETSELINADAIRKMKDGAILINTARGQIVEPNAVADALRSGKLAYAAFDVYTKEPVPDDYPLKNIENEILTPHIAGITADSFKAMMHDAFRNISSFDKGDMESIEPYRYI